MNRREFTQGLGALVTSPALPVKLAAGTLNSAIYERAVHFAKLWDRAAPEMFMGALNIDEPTTQHLLKQMHDNDVIGVPDKNGFISAKTPYWKHTDMALKSAHKLMASKAPLKAQQPQTKATPEPRLDADLKQTDHEEAPATECTDPKTEPRCDTALADSTSAHSSTSEVDKE